MVIWFCVKKEKILTLKVYGLFNNLVHELRVGDKDFYFK